MITVGNGLEAFKTEPSSLRSRGLALRLAEADLAMLHGTRTWRPDGHGALVAAARQRQTAWDIVGAHMTGVLSRGGRDATCLAMWIREKASRPDVLDVSPRPDPPWLVRGPEAVARSARERWMKWQGSLDLDCLLQMASAMVWVISCGGEVERSFRQQRVAPGPTDTGTSWKLCAITGGPRRVACTREADGRRFR